MNITCNREKLLAAFQTAAMVAPSRSPKPVLQNVKIIASESSTVLMATDMEVGVRIEVADVTVETPGSALLSVSQFSSILRESTDEQLSIEADHSGLLIRGERSKFKLPSSNPDEFPAVAEFSESKYHEIPVRLMKELIRRTLFATDSESSRYALGGVLFELEPEQVTAVGTDGRRLAKMAGPAQAIEGHDTGNTTTIVPSRALQLIERTLIDSDDTVKVTVRGNDILLQTHGATVSSRLVEGRFPRWRDVLPENREALTIDMTVGPLYSALRQAAIVASKESRGIDFTFGDGSLVLSGTTADVGESQVELPISYDGDEIVLCMDHRYVSDFLRVLDPEKSFVMNIVDGDSAALFQTDDGYGYVVMPLAREKAVAAATAAAVG
ncbi:MAG: DNA polymerase III subunit beta [Planctomycetales bacterium]|nr:DNA polymerase III subunit beta [Planctomycetales bacterium]